MSKNSHVQKLLSQEESWTVSARGDFRQDLNQWFSTVVERGGMCLLGTVFWRHF